MTAGPELIPDDGKDPQLSRLLRAWDEPSEVPPRFREAVWRRIERGSAPAGPRSTASRLNEWLTWLSRPAFAMGYLLLLLAAGAGAGALQGQGQAESLSGALAGRYVQSIDPFHR